MSRKHSRVTFLASPQYALKRSLRRSKRLERVELVAELFGTVAGL